MNRLLPIDIKFEMEIPNQTQAMLQKPCHLQSPEMKNPIWRLGGHFENDATENQ